MNASVRRHLIGIASLALLAGCGRADSGNTAGQLDRCALLTDEEVEQAIGPHDGGKMAVENPWGLLGCKWTAKQFQGAAGFHSGYDAIHVAVFDNDLVEYSARGDAEGDPVADFVPGALYEPLSGELWFDCAGDRFCVVQAELASAEHRAAHALRLARSAEARLR